MKGFEKFLSNDALKAKAKTWQELTKIKERKGPDKKESFANYVFDRLDEQGENYETIRDLHGISFIEDVIPRLVEKKRKGEKVRILDIGGGGAAFTDQIRKTFGDAVKVYSTGLSKKTARDFRKDINETEHANLHPDDLKWRSVLELSNFEEFDLIVDTYGEFYYTNEATQYSFAAQLQYISTVVAKLTQGGMAFITPYISSDMRKIANFITEKNPNVTFQLITGKGIRIEKHADASDQGTR